jgi:hypothetical protein
MLRITHVWNYCDDRTGKPKSKFKSKNSKDIATVQGFSETVHGNFVVFIVFSLWKVASYLTAFIKLIIHEIAVRRRKFPVGGSICHFFLL